MDDYGDIAGGAYRQLDDRLAATRRDGYCSATESEPPHRFQDLAERERRDLVEWAKAHIRFGGRRKRSSYGIKVDAGDALGRYVSNLQMKCAMSLAGFGDGELCGPNRLYRVRVIGGGR